MSRIPGVPAKEVGVGVKLAYFFTRRSLRQLTGRDPEGGIAPLEMYAYAPGLMRAYGSLEQATAKLSRLHRRLRGLAELKAATMVECEFCIDLGSEVARRWGIGDEQLLALGNHRQSALFTPLEKLVLDYAVCMSRTPVDVPEDLFANLQKHLSSGQLVELTHIIALENLRGRFNLALGIKAAGYSEGRVCASPASAAELSADGVARRHSAEWKEVR